MGQIADTALRQMHDEGYGCQIGYVDLPQLEADGVTIRMVRTPRVFCASYVNFAPQRTPAGARFGAGWW